LSASFDCRKATRPIEKFICSNPELDAADGRMGEAYRRVNASFPLKGFVQVTQRGFVAGFPYCMHGTDNRPSTGPASLRRCVDMVQQRIAEIETYERSIVYSSTGDRFTPEDTAMLVHGPQGARRILMWGSWMPHAFAPKPFPDGAICDIDEPLKAVRGGFAIDGYDAVMRISEKELDLSETIFCTGRNGIAPGSYRRVR